MKSKLIYTCLLSFLFILIVFIVIGLHNKLSITYYDYYDASVPTEFDGYKICFLSDFHCKKFGDKEEKLIEQIRLLNPDVIMLGGDMIDEKHLDLTNVTYLLEGIKEYPIYAIAGNHEYDDNETFQELLALYKTYNVTFLNDSFDIISSNNSCIGIYGIPFKETYTDILQADQSASTFNILLTHDATRFNQFRGAHYQVVLAGHTHGGIIRLPLIGGLISNNKTVPAKYDNGTYEFNYSVVPDGKNYEDRYSIHCVMYSNRGLGDSFLPRFYNDPEILCITLHHTN